MIEKIKNSYGIKAIIKNFLSDTKVDNIDDIKIQEGLSCLLIYPTNDLLLTEKQFKALVDFNLGDAFFIIQLGENRDFLADTNDVFKISYPFSYDEYSRLAFYSLTVIFSQTGKWFLVLDESLGGGEGLLVGKQNLISCFENYYQESKIDLLRFVNFQIDDYNNRGYIGLIKHLDNIIKKLI